MKKLAIITMILMMSVVWASAGLAELKIKVRDATGKRVGKVVSFANTGLVPIIALKDSSGDYFTLAIDADGFHETSFIWFEEDDCTGTPMILVKQSSMRRAEVYNPTGVLYLAAKDAPTVLVPIGSRLPRLSELTVGDTCIKAQTFPVEGDDLADEVPRSLEVVITTPIMDLLNEFTPPFRIEITDGQPE